MTGSEVELRQRLMRQRIRELVALRRAARPSAPPPRDQSGERERPDDE